MEQESNRWNKVGRSLIVYLGSSWVLLEALSFFIDRYGLPGYFQHLLLLILFFGLPIFILHQYVQNAKNKWFLVITGGYSIIAILSFRILLPMLSDNSQQATDSVQFKRMGVEKFINNTGTDSLEYLVKAIQSSIIQELGNEKDLIVTSLENEANAGILSASMIGFSRKDEIDAVMRASISGDQDSIVLEVKLSSETGDLIWSESFHKPPRNILQMYSDVSLGIIGQLFGSSKVVETIRPAINDRSYLLYWKARSYMDQLTEKDLNIALKYLHSAIGIDSTYSVAWSGVAMCWGYMHQMNLITNQELVDRGIPPLNKALKFGPDYPEVQHAKGVIGGWYLWNWQISHDGFGRAIELNPNDPSLYAGYAHILAVNGKLEQALEHNRKALEMEPFNARYLSFYAMTLNNARMYEEAKSTMTDEYGDLIDNGLTYSTLRTTYHLTQEFDKAGEMWIASYKSSDPEAASLLEESIEKIGYFDALNELADLMIRRRAEGAFIPSWNIGTMLVRAQSYEESLDWLEKAYDEHSGNMPYLAVDPIFDPIKSNPRYQALVKKLGLRSI